MNEVKVKTKKKVHKEPLFLYNNEGRCNNMVKCRIHDDSDGITGGVLYKKAHPETEIEIPNEFGDTSDWQSGDVMIDMVPTCSDIEGIVIDHHLGHSDNRKYTLHWSSEVPASVIVYNLYKDNIPDDDKWKVVVGCVGDVSPESIPIEIWEMYPELLDIDMYDNPMFFSLSPCINAYCRVGKYYEGFQKLYEVKDPLDLLSDKEIAKYKRLISKEVQTIISEMPVHHYDHVTLLEYESDYSIGGYLAAKLGPKIPVVVYNSKSKSGSIRGYLCSYIKDILEKSIEDIVIGGHPSAMGFTLQNEDDIEIVKKVLKEI